MCEFYIIWFKNLDLEVHLNSSGVFEILGDILQQSFKNKGFILDNNNIKIYYFKVL